ncbi:threonine aldolase [Bernardetia litoralis DSM 6794]|uniref:Threonine aldolase n=1 Tax=Bernardetia litoralis (strain ATCC 23117 / DSM 6794 / NBRC 15988 / NCIMB 1366 / Fx l1 / Sio-4) TaxID=880071 RepID=I4AF77_BERLS|nr:GntG family PLP-dependent aldolase [Bernardetia litoralis]AFM02612.1 threonine aldolase [Bernardetia litoralis DSM 6794]
MNIKNIDLRSDTFTLPSKEMKEAMMNAKVGDDVWDEDPTVKELETKIANLFGHEAALFCPSGTMTNQIALKILTQPQDDIICDIRSHIYQYEGGGIAYNSLCSVRLLQGEKGILTTQMIEEAIMPDDIHFPRSRVVALENTVNKAGGSSYKLEEIKAISELCKKNNLKLHLDGARIFNALVYRNQSAKELGQYFDTISVCLSKGLGAPVGSVLLANKELIHQAKRVRKVLGGGMRQSGFLAAAGIYALNNNIEKLKEDNQNAGKIAESLKQNKLVEEVIFEGTNIVLFRIESSYSSEKFKIELAKKGILVSSFGKEWLRIVTHLDISKEMIERVCNEFLEIKEEGVSV